MPRPCSICAHPERAGIDSALAAAERAPAVARRFAVSADALQRHKTHVAKTLAKATEARQEAEVVHGGDLLGEIDLIRAEARRLGKLAEEEGNLRAALAALREWTRVEELRAKAQGIINDAPVLNVAVLAAPEWLALRTRLAEALEPFPEASAAVSLALAEPTHA